MPKQSRYGNRILFPSVSACMFRMYCLARNYFQIIDETLQYAVVVNR